MSDERPSSWAEAREAVDAATPAPSTESPAAVADPSSTPAGSSPAVSSSPETAVQPAAAPITPPTAQGTPGEPPQERWPTILENARKKEREAAAAEFQQRYAWVPQTVTPEMGQAILARHARMASDPVGFVTEALAELQQHPEYSQQLRSHAARMLASGRGAAALGPPAPDLDVLGDGKLMLRSPENEAALLEWHSKQMLAGVKQEFAPLVQSHEQRQQQLAHEAAVKEADTNARVLLDQVSKYPHFAENRQAIAAKFVERQKAAGGQIPDHLTGQVLHECYVSVLADNVLPTLDARSRSAALHALNDRARGTTANPSAPAPQSTGRPKSWADARRQSGLV